MRWRLSDLAALHWQHFDGDWVIFDDGSGQTLAVDAVMAATLMAIESGLTAEAEIARQVQADLGLTHDDGLADQLSAGLAFMAQLGVVEALGESSIA